jgi:hypothetical protein
MKAKLHLARGPIWAGKYFDPVCKRWTYVKAGEINAWFVGIGPGGGTTIPAVIDWKAMTVTSK